MRNNSHIIKCKGGNRKDEMSFKHVQYLTNTFSFLFINIYIYIYVVPLPPILLQPHFKCYKDNNLPVSRVM